MYGKVAKDKFRQILALTDPPPNWRYEIGCYLQSSTACFLIALGLVNLLLCFSLRVLISSLIFIFLGLFLLSHLKIIQELIKLIKEQ